MRMLVLLSGGIDSAVVLAQCLARGDECEAIGFDYGQPHVIELRSASEIARRLNIPFSVRTIPRMPLINGVEFAGRNLVLAAHAISYAQANWLGAIAVGCNASDWLNFPDCRPAFWKALANAAKTYGIRVATPLLHMTKAEVIEMARELGVPLELTWSCYSPRDGKQCGTCLACNTREGAMTCAA